MPTTPMTSFRLHADQRAALALIAGRRGCSRTDLIREAIDLAIAAEGLDELPPETRAPLALNERHAPNLAGQERVDVQATPV